VKYTLNFAFPNLPYLIDGEFKLTEQVAIMNYIVSKAGREDLNGKDKERFLVDELKSMIEEINFKTYLM
jgi:glutathione S-transferase